MKRILILDSILHVTVTGTLSQFYKERAVIESYQYESFPVMHENQLKNWLREATSFFKTSAKPEGKKYDVMFLSATIVSIGRINVKDLLAQYGSDKTKVILMSNEKTFPKLALKNTVINLNKEYINVFSRLSADTKNLLNRLLID